MKFKLSKILKGLFYIAGIGTLIILLIIYGCNYFVCSNSEGRLYSVIDSVPQYEVGLLLGTTPQTRIGRRNNQFFKYRIDATESLYKAGKIKTILISGDENSLDGVNEVVCMRDSLVARGIPKDAFILDGKGFRTLDAVVRATKVYGINSYIVISQKFHNERAIYLAEHLGLDVEDLSGFNAADATSNMAMMTYIREYFARVKVFVDIFTGKKPRSMDNPENEPISDEIKHYTTREDKENLVIYTPDYTSIDLVCGTMPDKSDKHIIFCAEAAFTGELLKEFKHSNILGDHVSAGKRYKGTGCKRNTGAFVYYSGKWKFIYKDYSMELDITAQNGGMGFGQEMMIHNGKRVQTIRKDSNKNEFRALCELKGKLCVIDSNGVSAFGDFIQALLSEGVSEAIYLDMGPGWNYSWWRDQNDKANEIHSQRIPYTTNWITFYK